jgi:hypothetical protein
MSKVSTIKAKQIVAITQILQGKPASPLNSLPLVWQRMNAGKAGTALSDKARMDYVEAARLFRYHSTPLAMESLSAIGKDFQCAAYPDLDALKEMAKTDLAKRTIASLQDLFEVFGYDVPAAFYNALLGTLEATEEFKNLRLFKNKKKIMQDRLWDAVLHAMLLVTPVGLYVHSVFSRHGLRFVHMMNCSCHVEIKPNDPRFDVHLDMDLLPAYLQNLVAASFEQYGVNASTSGASRGF